MKQILHHRDLIVWQKARSLVAQIYKAAAQFPAAEKYGLCSQIQRAAVSIVANIAEGKARGSRNEYAHFLSIANASAAELEALTDLAFDLEYLGQGKHLALLADIAEIRRMLQAMRKKLKTAA
jgi:four helix bundle protein